MERFSDGARENNVANEQDSVIQVFRATSNDYLVIRLILSRFFWHHLYPFIKWEHWLRTNTDRRHGSSILWSCCRGRENEALPCTSLAFLRCYTRIRIPFCNLSNSIISTDRLCRSNARFSSSENRTLIPFLPIFALLIPWELIKYYFNLTW